MKIIVSDEICPTVQIVWDAEPDFWDCVSLLNETFALAQFALPEFIYIGTAEVTPPYSKWIVTEPVVFTQDEAEKFILPILNNTFSNV